MDRRATDEARAKYTAISWFGHGLLRSMESGDRAQVMRGVAALCWIYAAIALVFEKERMTKIIRICISNNPNPP